MQLERDKDEIEVEKVGPGAEGPGLQSLRGLLRDLQNRPAAACPDNLRCLQQQHRSNKCKAGAHVPCLPYNGCSSGLRAWQLVSWSGLVACCLPICCQPEHAAAATPGISTVFAARACGILITWRAAAQCHHSPGWSSGALDMLLLLTHGIGG